jgi:DNA ligase-1
MKSNSLPILFSRTSTGAVQEWEIVVEGNTFYTIVGQQNGKKITTTPSICEGKNIGRANETTPAAQALSEAQSRWDKKARMGYTPDIKQIDSCMVYIEPMTAHKLLARLKKIDFKKGVLVQNKYNGHRCVARMEAGKVVLRTRTGKLYYSVPHINKDLEPFFDAFPDAVLDGELFNNELRTKLSEISEILRLEELTSDEAKRSENLIRFYVYDGYNLTDELDQESDYALRKQFIDKNLPKHCKYVPAVKTDWAYSMVEVDKIYNEYLADEQEGAIIRLPHSPYENKRSNNLLKYKPLDDDEGIITKIEQGTGDWTGAATVIYLKWKGKEFKGTFKGKYEKRAEILKKPAPYLNTPLTFLYNGLTSYGVPNYARVDPDNCFGGEK